MGKLPGAMMKVSVLSGLALSVLATRRCHHRAGGFPSTGGTWSLRGSGESLSQKEENADRDVDCSNFQLRMEEGGPKNGKSVQPLEARVWRMEQLCHKHRS